MSGSIWLGLKGTFSRMLVNTWYDSTVREDLQKLINTVLRPLVEADGGTLEASLEDDTLTISLGGTCQGCPGFHYTRDKLILPLLTKAIDEGQSILVSNTVSALNRPTQK